MIDSRPADYASPRGDKGGQGQGRTGGGQGRMSLGVFNGALGFKRCVCGCRGTPPAQFEARLETPLMREEARAEAFPHGGARPSLEIGPWHSDSNHISCH
ncbi:hypothetical protein DPEC_G00251760 [Dallia pectoralis]|uniref:Uncharacterized protein n=1 Tax=Dallia pectoralis TaxID=75939 RepID=A0ACC2FT78_DALPE|nr:hypothetical protein DPEC_G00251760 [Dallia pectoralis]